jgi:hypothetical protein
MKLLMQLLALTVDHQSKHITVTAETSSLSACVLKNKIAFVPHPTIHPI